MDALSLVGVSKSYPSKDDPTKRVPILEDISFSLQKGEVASVVGPTGCGKTTLLKIIAGLITRDAGEIIIGDASNNGSETRTAMVFQNFNLLPWRNVLQNVELGLELKLRSKEERRKTALTYLSMVGLSGYEKYHPHELSGGMQQRVGLARALAVEPSLVLFDEPFSSVDLLMRESLQDEVQKVLAKTGKTALFVTHNAKEAVFLSDKIITLKTNPGRIIRSIPVNLPRPRTAEVLKSSDAKRILSALRQDLSSAQYGFDLPEASDEESAGNRGGR